MNVRRSYISIRMVFLVGQITEKKPSQVCPEPTTALLSSKRFPISQYVSGSKAQLWHAARFNESWPCSADWIYIGSEEHQLAFFMAFMIVSSINPGLPWRTSPRVTLLNRLMKYKWELHAWSSFRQCVHSIVFLIKKNCHIHSQNWADLSANAQLYESGHTLRLYHLLSSAPMNDLW